MARRASDRSPTDRRTALLILRECGALLGEPLPPAERERIRNEFAAAMGVLERRTRLVRRVAELEHQMRNYPAGERALAVISRLALSRASYYRLRREAGFGESHESETGEWFNRRR